MQYINVSQNNFVNAVVYFIKFFKKVMNYKTEDFTFQNNSKEQ